MWRTRRGGPRTPSTTTDAHLDCAFVENALFLRRSLNVKSQQNRIELVARPVHQTELLEQEDQLWGRPHLKPVGHHGGTLRLQHSPGTNAHQVGGVERQGTKRKASP